MYYVLLSFIIENNSQTAWRRRQIDLTLLIDGLWWNFHKTLDVVLLFQFQLEQLQNANSACVNYLCECFDWTNNLFSFKLARNNCQMQRQRWPGNPSQMWFPMYVYVFVSVSVRVCVCVYPGHWQSITFHLSHFLLCIKSCWHSWVPVLFLL